MIQLTRKGNIHTVKKVYGKVQGDHNAKKTEETWGQRAHDTPRSMNHKAT